MSVRVLRIEREARRNALDRATTAWLRQSLDELAADENCRGIVITGAGTQAFCAGQDIKELATLVERERIAATKAGQRLMDEVEGHPCLIAAAVEGYCLGGGLELALACDVRITGRSAVFGLPEVSQGMLPTWGGHYRLSRVVGLGRAKEIVLLGRRLDAAVAHSCGLVAEVVDDGGAAERAVTVLSEATEQSTRQGAARAKMLLATGFSVDTRVARQLDELAEAAQGAG